MGEVVQLYKFFAVKELSLPDGGDLIVTAGRECDGFHFIAIIERIFSDGR